MKVKVSGEQKGEPIKLNNGEIIDAQPVYVANENCWFEDETICILIDDYRPNMNSGLFYGIRCCSNTKSENKEFGAFYYDEEVCQFDEFDVHYVYPYDNIRKTNKYDETSPEIEDMMKYAER